MFNHAFTIQPLPLLSNQVTAVWLAGVLRASFISLGEGFMCMCVGMCIPLPTSLAQFLYLTIVLKNLGIELT